MQLHLKSSYLLIYIYKYIPLFITLLKYVSYIQSTTSITKCILYLSSNPHRNSNNNGWDSNTSYQSNSNRSTDQHAKLPHDLFLSTPRLLAPKCTSRRATRKEFRQMALEYYNIIWMYLINRWSINLIITNFNINLINNIHETFSC